MLLGVGIVEWKAQGDEDVRWHQTAWTVGGSISPTGNGPDAGPSMRPAEPSFTP